MASTLDQACDKATSKFEGLVRVVEVHSVMHIDDPFYRGTAHAVPDHWLTFRESSPTIRDQHSD
jgi:hypothetical protein